MSTQPDVSRNLEASVIAELQHGDITRFYELYRAHCRKVFSLCFRMVHDYTLAEDLTQETFLAVFRRISTFRGESAFGTWLYRLAVNVVLMYLREQRNRIAAVSYEEATPGEDGPSRTYGVIDRILASTENRLVLQRAMDQLAPGYRLVFVLHDIEGYEHWEIAELLGCSPGNTKSQLHKARLKLRKLLVQAATTPVKRSR